MRRVVWAWCFGAVLIMLGCINPPPAPTAPILCSPIETPAAVELGTLPPNSPLKMWVVFTDRNTCRANQDAREKLGWPIPDDMRRGPKP